MCTDQQCNCKTYYIDGFKEKVWHYIITLILHNAKRSVKSMQAKIFEVFLLTVLQSLPEIETLELYFINSWALLEKNNGVTFL